MIPYKVSNGRIPVIIHVPHASTVFPKVRLEDGTVLNAKNDLRSDVEVIADKNIDLVSKRFFENTGLKPYWFESSVSRMFMDPERFNSEDEEMNQVGMGIVYTKNHNGEDIYTVPPSEEQVNKRIQSLYNPYTQAFSDTVDHILHKHNRCLILDFHSYSSTALPYELHSSEMRSPLVLGYDDFHIQKLSNPLSALCSRPYTSSNTVFKGSYVPLSHFGRTPDVSSVMLEFRKDIYMDEKSGRLLMNGETDFLSSMQEDVVSLVKDYLSQEG